VDDDKQGPYALKGGEGWTYDYHGIAFNVKAGELGAGGRAAFIEYTARHGEEPDDHTHRTEDEIFYVLEGAITFRCAGETFDLEAGGFIFLPRGMKHGYTVLGDHEVRLIVVTAPGGDAVESGWGGFISDVEASGELRSAPP